MQPKMQGWIWESGIKISPNTRRPYQFQYLPRAMHRKVPITFFLGMLILQITLTSAIASPNQNHEISSEPTAWPEGSAAYDNMVQMADFGYRQIDTQANFNARNWIASELEEMGYYVERQPFQTNECSNCENIVVTINGTLEDDWIVVGAHHDAICYSPPPLIGQTYPTCTSSGAYDDGTGSGSLLELARTFTQWEGKPLHSWKLGWWDYEEWQGSSSSEGGGKGSLHFVEEQIPQHVNVTYVNLDMFGLNWPVPTPLASQLSGCDEDFWTLYMFTSPVNDWSYYENNGLEVTDEMRDNAAWFQNHLKEINSNLSHPEEWVQVIDDTKGNSDHYNFIMHNHTATWIRGQHQYIAEEGDTCEQTPKHSQSDNVAVINNLAGGRNNLESGLQTGLDVVATLAWLDWAPTIEEEGESTETMAIGSTSISGIIFVPWFIAIFLLVGFISTKQDRFQLGMVLEEDSPSIIGGISSEEGNTLVDSYRARVLTLCALYVAQGIPWGFITVTFVTYLAVEGVAAKELALLLTLGTLPWSVKFLWGPVIDRYQFKGYGKRRPWILLAQSGMILILASMLLIPNPSGNVQFFAYMFLVYNIFTSLQDVSTDALAVDILKSHEIEKVNSYMFTSKTVGGIIGGAGLGTIIGFVGIKGAILLQIPILIVIMLVPLYMTERPGEKRFPWDEDNSVLVEENLEKKNFREIVLNIKTALSLKSTQLGVVLSLLVSISFFLVPILPQLFTSELGWTEEKFNATKGGLILIVTMLGYVIGGQLGKRFGGKLVIIYSTLITALFTTFWGLSQSMWDNGLFMLAMWSLRTLAWSIVMINAYSLMMKITWSEVGGTQFTGYMAMMNLSAIIGYQLTDPLGSRFDYSTLFLIAAVFETLVILGCLFIDPDETRSTLGSGDDFLDAEIIS